MLRKVISDHLSTGALDSFWPSVATIFAALVSRIALAFIARYPAPESAYRLGEKCMTSFPRQQGSPDG